MKPQIFSAIFAVRHSLQCGVANATVYSYDGTIDTFNVTISGIYDITAIGAAGGSNLYFNNTMGLPAEAAGQFFLTQGTVPEHPRWPAVAERGTSQQAEAAWRLIVVNGTTPLAVAGKVRGGDDQYWGNFIPAAITHSPPLLAARASMRALGGPRRRRR